MQLSSIPIAAFSPDEISAMRALGRTRLNFSALAQEATRLGFFGAKLVGRLDADAWLGLGMRQTGALLGLARMPALDAAQYGIKASLFRSWRESAADDSTLWPLLEAALAADATRLGLETSGPEVLQ